jgi:hypothetical protein
MRVRRASCAASVSPELERVGPHVLPIHTKSRLPPGRRRKRCWWCKNPCDVSQGVSVVGQLITRPILRSVERLRSNSGALNRLATKQQSAATEQMWVVDSSQVGLQSVQYYTNATSIAARRLSDMGLGLIQNRDYQNVESMRQVVSQMISAAQYIEKAAHYQTTSNQKLATAIKVTTQVNEQLAEGAISASDAASQLEQVVSELRQVVGR